MSELARHLPIPSVLPGPRGVIAGETALSYIDGERGRLLYRGYPIGDLVRNGSYATSRSCCGPASGTRTQARLPPVPRPVLQALRALPKTAKPMDALRTAVSAWGAVHDPSWPPTPDEARS